MNISITQAISLWTQLEECRRKENGYGGDEAEIYAYTLMPSSPGYHTMSSRSPEDAEMERAAGRALREMLLLFDRTYREVRISIEGAMAEWIPLSEWNLLGDFRFIHRIHVRVATRAASDRSLNAFQEWLSMQMEETHHPSPEAIDIFRWLREDSLVSEFLVSRK